MSNPASALPVDFTYPDPTQGRRKAALLFAPPIRANVRERRRKQEQATALTTAIALHAYPRKRPHRDPSLAFSVCAS